MEVKYIVSIAAGSLFVFLFLIAVGVFIFSKVQENKLHRQIYMMYYDDNLKKMQYDFANYDDETERIMSAPNKDGQLTIEDVLFDAAVSAPDEGLEEITGNYKPD